VKNGGMRRRAPPPYQMAMLGVRCLGLIGGESVNPASRRRGQRAKVMREALVTHANPQTILRHSDPAKSIIANHWGKTWLMIKRTAFFPC